MPVVHRLDHVLPGWPPPATARCRATVASSSTHSSARGRTARRTSVRSARSRFAAHLVAAEQQPAPDHQHALRVPRARRRRRGPTSPLRAGCLRSPTRANSLTPASRAEGEADVPDAAQNGLALSIVNAFHDEAPLGALATRFLNHRGGTPGVGLARLLPRQQRPLSLERARRTPSQREQHASRSAQTDSLKAVMRSSQREGELRVPCLARCALTRSRPDWLPRRGGTAGCTPS